MFTRLRKCSFILYIFLVLICGVTARAEKDTCTSYSGNNINAQNYIAYGKVVNSYLTLTSTGQYMRVQGNATKDDGYLVEYYDSSFDLVDTKLIEQELPIFGGFYFDGSNYYILSGQINSTESNETEVYRITKYSTTWKRLGSASLYGANTYIPFDAGSARMDHDGSLLFIRTCHEMYKSSDGYHHQANVTIEVDTSAMTVVDSYYGVMNVSYGYVSHSFNEFIKLKDGYIVGVDHGDAYPRSIVMCKYNAKYSATGFTKSCTPINLLPISGESGANSTGVSVGGFEISSTNYLVAGNMVKMGDGYNASATRNIFVSSLNCENGTTATNHMITNYENGDTSPSTPQFVKINDTYFLLLWMKDGQIQYCKINSSGEKVGNIYSMKGNLSDCKPIVNGNKIVWYTWKNGLYSFYTISTENLSSTSCVERTVGHDFAVTNATSENEIATRVCKTCGHEESFSTMSSFSLWWWTGGSGTSYISGDAVEGDVHQIGLRSATPSTAENKELTMMSSDPSIMQVDDDSSTFRFVGTGTVTLTIAVKYRPDVKIQKTFTVSHIQEGEENVICASTCTEQGTREFYCSFCKKTVSEKLPLAEHELNIQYATENSSSANVKCRNCSFEETFSTPDKIYVWWWTGYSGSSVISKTAVEGDVHEVSLRNTVPSVVDNSEFVLSSSDESVIKTDGLRFTLVGAGTATLTISAKYRPSVTIKQEFVVSHKIEGEGEVTLLPTCTTKGIRETICNYCNKNVQEEIPIDSNNHDMTRVVSERIEPTCVADGREIVYGCSRCDYQEGGNAISNLGREHDYETTFTTDKGPTCAEEGSKSRHCKYCPAKIDITAIEKTEHTWNLGETTKEPTCVEKGVKTYTCTFASCGATKTEDIVIDPDNHDMTRVISDRVEATCTDEGKEAVIGCSRCDYQEGGSLIARLGMEHDYQLAFTIDVEPTCEANGSKSRHCNNCTASIDVTEIEATGHIWDDGKVTKPATCIEKGEIKYTCTVAGCNGYKVQYLETDEEQHTGKTKRLNEKIATCANLGYTGDEYCADCNALIGKGRSIAATGVHKYGGYKTTVIATALQSGLRVRSCSECGCQDQQTITKLKATIKISQNKVTLKKKKSITIKVTNLAKGDYIKSWKTSSKKVALVNKKGKITAKKKGKARITVTLASGKKAIITVKVK